MSKEETNNNRKEAKRPRCPPGYRRNPKTKKCERTKKADTRRRKRVRTFNLIPFYSKNKVTMWNNALRDYIKTLNGHRYLPQTADGKFRERFNLADMNAQIEREKTLDEDKAGFRIAYDYAIATYMKREMDEFHEKHSSIYIRNHAFQLYKQYYQEQSKHIHAQMKTIEKEIMSTSNDKHRTGLIQTLSEYATTNEHVLNMAKHETVSDFLYDLVDYYREVLKKRLVPWDDNIVEHLNNDIQVVVDNYNQQTTPGKMIDYKSDKMFGTL